VLYGICGQVRGYTVHRRDGRWLQKRPAGREGAKERRLKQQARRTVLSGALEGWTLCFKGGETTAVLFLQEASGRAAAAHMAARPRQRLQRLIGVRAMCVVLQVISALPKALGVFSSPPACVNSNSNRNVRISPSLLLAAASSHLLCAGWCYCYSTQAVVVVVSGLTRAPPLISSRDTGACV
jgi:hypothetical protein